MNDNIQHDYIYDEDEDSVSSDWLIFALGLLAIGLWAGFFWLVLIAF